MSALTTQKKIAGLLAWLVLCFAAAGAGAVATIQAQSFYTGLTKAAWAPPPNVFGPVWTVLYVMIAISAWLVWCSGGLRANQRAFTLFMLQLALNALWSWLFFAWHRGGLAFAEIIILWLFIVATLVSFWRVNRLAGTLLIPYLLWVSFASVLNYSIWQLNPLILS